MLQEICRYTGMKILGRYVDKLQEKVLKKCINNVRIHQNIILESSFFSLKTSLLENFFHLLEAQKADITYIFYIMYLFIYINLRYTHTEGNERSLLEERMLKRRGSRQKLSILAYKNSQKPIFSQLPLPLGHFVQQMLSCC